MVAKDEVVGHMGLAFLINVYVYLRRLLGGMSEIMGERAKTLKNLGATKANFQKEFLHYIHCTISFIAPQSISAWIISSQHS